MTYRSTLQPMRKVLYTSGTIFNKGNVFAQVGYGIGGVRDVAVYPDIEVTDVFPVPQFKFNAGGFQVGQVSRWRSQTGITRNSNGPEDAGCFFVKPVERQAPIAEK